MKAYGTDFPEIEIFGSETPSILTEDSNRN